MIKVKLKIKNFSYRKGSTVIWASKNLIREFTVLEVGFLFVKVLEKGHHISDCNYTSRAYFEKSLRRGIFIVKSY